MNNAFASGMLFIIALCADVDVHSAERVCVQPEMYSMMKASAYTALISGAFWAGSNAKLLWITHATMQDFSEGNIAWERRVEALSAPYETMRIASKGAFISSTLMLCVSVLSMSE